MDVWLHPKNQYSNSNLSEDTNNLFIQSTLGMAGHAWPNPTKITWSKFSFHKSLIPGKKMNFIPQIVFNILKFKQLYNIIGKKHFCLLRENQIFHRHVVFTELKQQQWCNIKNKKKHALMDHMFFKICIADLLYQQSTLD